MTPRHQLLPKRESIFVALLPCLVFFGEAHAQVQSISTYGSGIGLGPTTTILPTGNGYTYSTIGGPSGGSWGGVIASPGTAVQAAIGPNGTVVPIVSTVPAAAPAPDPALVAAQIAAANAQQLAADAQLMAAMETLPPRPAPICVARAIPVIRPDPTKAEFDSFFAKIGSKERRAQFLRDFQADFPAGSVSNFPTRAALPYLKLWLRDHETAPLPEVPLQFRPSLSGTCNDST